MRIIEKLESLRRREHSATVELIAALVECYTSKAYLDAGSESIWDLLVRRLDYSFAAASRRNAATKIVARYPFVLEMLRSQRTSLTVLAKVVGPLGSTSDPIGLLKSIDGKSQREVERIVALGRPVAKPVERVRRQVVRKPAAKPAPLLDCGADGSSGGGASGAEVVAASGAGLATSGAEVATVDGDPAATSGAEVATVDGTGFGTSAAEVGAARTSAAEAAAEPETEERVSLSFSLTAEDYESFEQAKAILARKLPADMSIEDAFNELVAFYLTKKKPTRTSKSTGRKKAAGGTERPRSAETSADGRAGRTSTGTEVESATEEPGNSESAARPGTRGELPTEVANATGTAEGAETADGTETANATGTASRLRSEPRSRHIPANTRAAVFDRDAHRCSYVAADGTRCNATRNLEIDHVEPFALGGSHEAENLRVLCAAHNRRAAERVFGTRPQWKSQRDRC